MLDKHLPMGQGDKSELMRPRPELSLGVHWASQGQSSSPPLTPTRWKMQQRSENDCYFSHELLLSGLSHCCRFSHHLPDSGTSSSHPFSASLPQNLIQSGPFQGQPTSVHADALNPSSTQAESEQKQKSQYGKTQGTSWQFHRIPALGLVRSTLCAHLAAPGHRHSPGESAFVLQLHCSKRAPPQGCCGVFFATDCSVVKDSPWRGYAWHGAPAWCSSMGSLLTPSLCSRGTMRGCMAQGGVGVLQTYCKGWSSVGGAQRYCGGAEMLCEPPRCHQPL